MKIRERMAILEAKVDDAKQPEGIKWSEIRRYRGNWPGDKKRNRQIRKLGKREIEQRNKPPNLRFSKSTNSDDRTRAVINNMRRKKATHLAKYHVKTRIDDMRRVKPKLPK